MSVESCVPADHPIRMRRLIVDAILSELDGALVSRYAAAGFEPIPPAHLHGCYARRCCR